MNNITRMQLDDVINQVIIDLNPGLGDDATVDAIENPELREEAMELIIETLQDEITPKQEYKVPFMEGIEESLNNLSIRK